MGDLTKLDAARAGEMESADVVIVGAGPTGLMLAGELGLAGVRALVLEQLPDPSPIAKAGGLSGQIIHLLRYRGEWERFTAVADGAPATGRFPWGDIHVDLTSMAAPPLEALMLPQPRLEAALAERAGKAGATIRRGHALVGLQQDGERVTAVVQGPDGQYQVSARYLAGCDGARSRTRKLAGIGFPGMTYPEVNRLARVALDPAVKVLEDGDIEVPGLGRLKAGFTATEHGRFAFSAHQPNELGVYVSTREENADEIDDAGPMTLDELRASVRRVLGGDLPMGEAQRLARFTFHARQAERYRHWRVFLAGDAVHLFPASGVALNAGLIDAVNLGWKLAAAVSGRAPATLLDSYETERRHAADKTMWHAQAQVGLRRGHDPAAEALRQLVQVLLADEPAARRVGAMIAATDIRYPMPGRDLHPLAGAFASDLVLQAGAGRTNLAAFTPAVRPVLLDLAGRPELREAAAPWLDRIEVQSATADGRPADALLIRPDAVVAWAAAVNEPAATALASLREALAAWFGAPGDKRR